MSSILESWNEEQQSNYLYQIIAQKSKHPKIKDMFGQLGRMALNQSLTWEKLAKEQGIILPAYQPNARVRFIAFLVKKIGIVPMKSILAAMKIRGLSALRQKLDLANGHHVPTRVEDVGGRHHGQGAVGNLRAAVFGINDGLISIASLVLGMMGAQAEPQIIWIAGVTGCLSGALSMAAGEFVSVKSQREMFEYQIALEKEELKEYPKEEALELALIYQTRGFSHDEAHTMAEKMIADPKLGLDTLAREELGLDPDDLTSPWGAAISSFLSFTVGGLLPLVPLLMNNKSPASATILITLTSLLCVGGLISLWTGRSAILSAFRMAFIGSIAGLITYFAGHFFIP